METKTNDNVIVLVTFGAKNFYGREIYFNLLRRVKERFSQFDTAILFLSDREISVDIEIGLLSESYSKVFVQPIFLCNFETYNEMISRIPGKNIVFGDHLIGNVDDLQFFLPLFKDDFLLAEKNLAGIVYLGHGGKDNSLILKMDEFMNKIALPIKVYFGTIHGEPGVEVLTNRIKGDGIDKVYLKPFMITRGYHVDREFDLKDESSFYFKLKKELKDVTPVRDVLGEKHAFAQLVLDKIDKKIEEFQV